MYLKNAWYVVAWGHELKDVPVPVVIMDEHVVLFRTEDGIAALEDRCPHRHLPLSSGKICGALIQCGYHGAQFNDKGKCVHIPTQSLVPASARVRSYPAIEQWGWVWIWPGDPQRADTSLLPDFSKLTDPRYAAVGRTNHVRCHYQSLIDNLLDLSHVGFVHTTTIGNQQMGTKGELTQEATSDGVRVTRWVLDTPPPPTTQKLGIFPEGALLDRSQVIDYIAPSSVIIHAGNSLADAPARHGKGPHQLNFYILNFVTPRDSENCYYFWAAVRDYATAKRELDDIVLSQIAEAFDEDRVILEKQQEVFKRRGDDWSLTFKADIGVVQARRRLTNMIASEQQADVA